MPPQDEDRRTLWLCLAIVIAPIVCAAAQVATGVIVERFVIVPSIVAAMKPLAMVNGCLAGGLAAWAAVLLPGGRLGLTVAAALSAFIVGAAIYAVALGLLFIAAAIVF
ncbi:MAG: hypothetical protein M3552_23130 [Planctomycetota bacterium]|nr:hypothetical protein [Planctomycetota bacterium]